MSAGVIVAIAIGVIVLVVLAALLFKRGRESKLEGRRIEARDTRREATVRDARAQRAEAERQKAEADAKEAAAVADRERRAAGERHEYAENVDPDS